MRAATAYRALGIASCFFAQLSGKEVLSSGNLTKQCFDGIIQLLVKPSLFLLSYR